MRTLKAVGRIHAKGTRLARLCAWCSTWFTDDDRRLAASGAYVTHGMCPACSARVNAEIDAMPEPPEAA